MCEIKNIEKKLLNAKVGDTIIYRYQDEYLIHQVNEKITVEKGAVMDGWLDTKIKITNLSSVVDVMKGDYTLDVKFSIGSDPELFLKKNRKVVPSAMFIRKGELESVTPDGFQAELHPLPSFCRESAGFHIATALKELSTFAKKNKMSLSFKVGEKISEEVWKATPQDVKKFGCRPTLSAYSEENKRGTGLDETLRTGGGHIHIDTKYAKSERESLVRLLDVVVGNTLVLIDRDEANVQRRKNYGRAGEYREKPYGIEYRVPSNFWLRGYVLWSFVAGLVRNAITIRANKLEKKLLSAVDEKKIRDAINNNDYNLAMENFLVYKQFLLDNNVYMQCGVSKLNVENFLWWASTEDPLSYINKGTTKDILRDWESKRLDYRYGFESFINNFKE